MSEPLEDRLLAMARRRWTVKLGISPLGPYSTHTDVRIDYMSKNGSPGAVDVAGSTPSEALDFAEDAIRESEGRAS